MKAVITVIGKDMVGILAKVSALCARHNVNVVEVTDITPWQQATKKVIEDNTKGFEDLYQQLLDLQ